MLKQWTGEMQRPPNMMLSDCQADYLNNLDNILLPTGAIVELGPWLGGSTRLLNQYVGDGEHHVYDLFKWEKGYMDKDYTGDRMYEQDDSFLPEFEQNTRDLKGLVIHEQSLNQSPLTEHGPIKLLFLDALKNVYIATDCLPQLLPDVMVGGLMIDQDFLWEPITHSFMYLFMYRMRDYFTPIVQADCLLSWIKVKEINREEVRRAVSWTGSLLELNNSCLWYLSICKGI